MEIKINNYFIRFFGIMGVMLLPLEIFGEEQSISLNDLKNYKTQNIFFTKKLESFFDNENPGYNSIKRRDALYMVDDLTQYPSPHSDALKKMFLNRYKKALDSIRKTKVEKGVVVWNIYNASYIVKTKEITVAFDLIRLPYCLRKDGDEDRHKKLLKKMIGLCDVLFVSHIHGDHADSFVAREFLAQNKQVIAPPDVFTNEDFYDKVTHLTPDGKKIKFKVPKANTNILLRIFPGHQAISADTAVDNNFTVVTFPNRITVAHSGDQSWKDDFKWLDKLYKKVDIDILMINTWTQGPDRMIKGLRPNIILPCHINEMSHPIPSRISFRKSYSNWQNGGKKVIHLFWAEPYKYREK